MSLSKDRIARLTELGQALWLDTITRRMIESGDLAAMIARGDIRGVTSNPTIFNHAIGKSNDYDNAIMPLAWAGWNPEAIFWRLAVEDITAACDLFRPVYDQNHGGDGFVSIEVSPHKAHDTAGTISQVKELWAAVNRPNLMVKIPATKEGVPAIHDCLAAGLNINITLIFSRQRYAEVMEAYLSALEERVEAGLPIHQLSSVASFFVSRVDTKVDKRLPKDSPLRGRAGIANAKLAYRDFQTVFGGDRFETLREKHDARVQRPLWASTSTKNPDYPDTLYADNLIGPDTVDTIPPETLEAFRDHGRAEISLTQGVDEAARALEELEATGIHMDQVTQELEDEGVKSFADSYDELRRTIESRCQTAAGRLGALSGPVSDQIQKFEAENVPARLHRGDPALWTDDPEGQAEVRKRLGWLQLPATSRALLPELLSFPNEVRSDGYTHALLLGMGGSSLAPEVMSLVFSPTLGPEVQGLSLAVLDSTDPAQIAEAESRAPLNKTLFVLSSKSGGTAEVTALFDYFWKQTQGNGEQWIAITDPGTSLEKRANQEGFRRTFLADPSVGGRYSALAAFGLVPAALMGIDISRLLDRAAWMSAQCAIDVPAARNPGLALGAIMARAALEGRDKLTIVADEGFAPFGTWVEQLIAESSGKAGKGIVPVVDEPLSEPEDYGKDRLFVYLRSTGSLDAPVGALTTAGHPAVVLPMATPFDLGAEFYRWEYAVATACAVLRINAFDQPDVQDAKDRTKNKLSAYKESGNLSEDKPAWTEDGVRFYSTVPVTRHGLKGALDDFLAKAGPKDYVAINAYVPRTAEMASRLGELRAKLRRRTGCATTLGFGPRFLHSTGQLHKGGTNEGVFLELTMDPAADIEIPGEGASFGLLERAQALGDYEALAARGRRVLRIHFKDAKSLAELLEALA